MWGWGGLGSCFCWVSLDGKYGTICSSRARGSKWLLQRSIGVWAWATRWGSMGVIGELVSGEWSSEVWFEGLLILESNLAFFRFRGRGQHKQAHARPHFPLSSRIYEIKDFFILFSLNLSVVVGLDRCGLFLWRTPRKCFFYFFCFTALRLNKPRTEPPCTFFDYFHWICPKGVCPSFVVWAHPTKRNRFFLFLCIPQA